VNIPSRDILIMRSATETWTENIVGSGDQEGNSDQRGDRECNSDKRVPEAKALKSGAPALGGATHISSFADGGEVHLRTGLRLCTGAIYIVSNLYDHSAAHTDTVKIGTRAPGEALAIPVWSLTCTPHHESVHFRYFRYYFRLMFAKSFSPSAELLRRVHMSVVMNYVYLETGTDALFDRCIFPSHI
jgi:hypothetical protein